MKTNSHRAFFLLSTLLAGAIAASAQFALIDDFQADPGPLNGHNGWTSNGGLIVEDPEDPENTVANFTSGSGDRGSFLPAVIPNNTTATLFLKLRVATDNAVTSTPVLNWSVGMSDIAISGNGGFGDYQAQLNQNRDDGNTLPQQVRSRNAGNFDTLADLQAGVWYKFWMVIDNGANTYQVFMEGGQFPSQTLLQNPGGVSTFAFRNAGDRVNNDLIRLFVRLPGSHQGDLYLDEVWLDTAGENLTDPTESEDSPPRIVDLSPARGAMFHAPATGLSFRATSFNPNGIPTTGFNLVLNGEDVSSSLAVGGTAMDRTVSFAGLEADRLYSGSITVTDADERATTATVSFDTFTESAAVFYRSGGLQLC